MDARDGTDPAWARKLLCGHAKCVDAQRSGRPVASTASATAASISCITGMIRS